MLSWTLLLLPKKEMEKVASTNEKIAKMKIWSLPRVVCIRCRYMAFTAGKLRLVNSEYGLKQFLILLGEFKIM